MDKPIYYNGQSQYITIDYNSQYITMDNPNILQWTIPIYYNGQSQYITMDNPNILQ